MQKHISYIGALCGLALLAQSPLAAAGSAVTVPMAARDTAAAAKADAQAVLDRAAAEKYKLNAEKEAAHAGQEAANAAQQVKEAENALVQTEQAADTAEQDAEQAASSQELLEEQAQEAAETADEAAAAADSAAAEADQLAGELRAQDQSRAEAIAEHAAVQQQTPSAPAPTADYTSQLPDDEQDELLVRENEFRRLEAAYEAERQARQTPAAAAADTNWEAPPAADWSSADSAYANASALAENAGAALQQANDARQQAADAAAAASAASEKALQLRQQAEARHAYLKNAADYSDRAADYAVRAKDALKKLLYDQEHPRPVYTYSTGARFYQWRNDDGSDGHQLLFPFALGYWQKDFSWYLATNLVNSVNNTSGASGSVTTPTDTVLYLTKRNEKKKFIVDYRAEINFPTGKAPLSFNERNARMNDDLWEKSMFGEGWKFAPGIDVSWKIGKEDTWTIGTSYSFNGSYDPTSDHAGDTVNPGNGWNHHLRWEHAGQAWQFVGELLYSGAGRSHLYNGSSYSTNSQLEYRLTYNRVLSKTTDWMLYYWHENRNVNTYVSDTSQAGVHYLGTMLSHKIGKAHTIRYTFDFMHSDGRCSSNVYNFYNSWGESDYQSVDVNGRTKYTLGIGYDILLSPRSSLSMDIEAFRMNDGSSTRGRSAASYKGMNFLIKYTQSF